MKLYIIILIILVGLLIYFQEFESESFNLVSLDDIPIIIISKSQKFKDSKKRLNQLGFKKIYRVEPVYLNKDTICSKRKIGLSELGCIEAHKNCFRKVSQLKVPCIILEEDWDYTISSNDFKKKIINYYNYYISNNLDVLWLGHCGDACMHAYIIGPKCSNQITNLNYCDSPVDLKLYKLCKLKSLKCYKVVNEGHSKNHFGSGLIFQDRKNNLGMHDHTNSRTSLWY
jgi:hypothetical protein